MRTEKDMYDLILGVARADQRIRAVYMNGSRANPRVSRDIFQDYDIVYVVDQTASFIVDQQWIRIFGEHLIIQLPYEMDRILGQDVDFSRHYAYLMQFADGTRIDLTILSLEQCLAEFHEDKLTVILLDKDGILPAISPPSDEDYRVRKPTQGLFDCCCNEFWWISLYVAKGLWRGEILYALDHMNQYLRPQLLTLVSWYAGLQNDFTISVGKNSKYLNQFLPEPVWRQLLATYPEASEQAIWTALDQACRLFDGIAREMAQILDLTCQVAEAENCQAYLDHVKLLSRTATEIV